MTATIVCAAVIVAALIAVALMANSRRLYRLNVDASRVACALKLQCEENLKIFKSYLFENGRIEIGYGTEPVKTGFWPWQRNFRPLVIVIRSNKKDEKPVEESFRNGLAEYKRGANGSSPAHLIPHLRFQEKGERDVRRQELEER